MNKSKSLRGFVISCFTLFLFLAVSTAVFAGGKEEPPPAREGPMDIMEAVRQEGSVLHIIDWAEWWPEEIYEGFSKEYGIKIVRDNFASVDDMVTKIKLDPNAGYDITFPEIRGTIQMRELGLLQELNHDWLPNAEKYLPETTKNAWYDPGYKYTIATDLYFLAWLYNRKYVDENDPDISRPSAATKGSHRAHRGHREILLTPSMSFLSPKFINNPRLSLEALRYESS